MKKKQKSTKDEQLKGDAKRWMWSQASSELYSLLLGGGALMVSSYSNQAVPNLIGKLIDPSSTFTTSKKNEGNSMIMNIIWVGLVGGAASFVRTYVLNNAEGNIAARLRLAAFESLMTRHDLEWFQVEGKDEITSDDTEKVTVLSKGQDPVKKDMLSSSSLGMTPGAVGVILKEDVDTVAKTMTMTVASFLRSCSSIIFGSWNMILLNPSLFGLSLAVAPAVGSIALMTRKYVKKVELVQHDAAINAASFVEERLNHIAMVKMSNRQKHEVETFSKMQEQLALFGTKSAFANGLSMGTLFFLSTSALSGIMVIGGKSVESRKMGHGQLVSFGTYSFLLALGSAGVVKAMGDYARGVQSAVRLYSIVKLESQPDIEQDQTNIKKTRDSVDQSLIRGLTIDQVCFSYRSEPSVEVLKDISIKLSRSEVVAMVGKNGAGKSTIAMMLAGLHRPASGRIFVEIGADNTITSSEIDFMEDLSVESRSKFVQVVPQQPAIFGTTILENVRYSRPTASEDDVMQALKAANADNFVSKLEGGMYYQVGRNGSRLSGGQRQRLGLARALLANPSFLVLDEPASSLDADGESAVEDAIRACRNTDRSLLLITHRSKTVSLADRVVVLKAGEVVEQGTLSELKKKKGELLTLMPDIS